MLFTMVMDNGALLKPAAPILEKRPKISIGQRRACWLACHKHPSWYNPLVHFALTRVRQRHVLDRLVSTGELLPKLADATFAELTQFGC